MNSFIFVLCIRGTKMQFDLSILQDLNNFESDPEEFARTLCKDLGVEDPEVGVR